jgi:SAM-dependent methyltransferase
MIGPRRIVARLRWRVIAWRLRGDAVVCPCCGNSFRRFADGHGRTNVECPRCGAHDRHRMLRLWLEERGELGQNGRERLLHIAPEYSVGRWLRTLPQIEYVTSDYPAGGADLALDVTNMDLPDESFDTVLCSHVLEHIEDEPAALREIARVLRPGGRAIVLVPVDYGRGETYEDPAIVAPEERRRAYWQDDHLRLYGRDVTRRLGAAGLHVTAHAYGRELGPELCERYRLPAGEEIFVCSKPRPPADRAPAVGQRHV